MDTAGFTGLKGESTHSSTSTIGSSFLWSDCGAPEAKGGCLDSIFCVISSYACSLLLFTPCS